MLLISAVSVISSTRLSGFTDVASSSRRIMFGSSRSSTERPERFTSSRTSWPWRSRSSIRRIARATTQRSIDWTRPKRSATPRKAPGGISSPSSPFIRRSSSCCEISPVAMSRIGCACSTNRSSSSAWWMRSIQVERERRSAWPSESGLKVTTRSRPASLASYMARSAAASTSSPLVRSFPNRATPRLEVSPTERPSAIAPCSRISRSRSAPTISAASLVVWGNRIANSSPPRRATMSDSRRRSWSSFATPAGSGRRRGGRACRSRT